MTPSLRDKVSTLVGEHSPLDWVESTDVADAILSSGLVTVPVTVLCSYHGTPTDELATIQHQLIHLRADVQALEGRERFLLRGEL